MTWLPHEFVLPFDVVWYWGCVALPEQSASATLAITASVGTGVMVAAVIDAIFTAAAPAWWERRVAAWRGNWSILEITIPIEGVDTRVYTSSAGWVTLLHDALLEGEVSIGDDECPTRPIWSMV